MYQIKTITFHHAHNVGSVLQTYALQEFVVSLAKKQKKELNYEIIDFHTHFQEKFYSIFKANNSLKNVLKNFVAFLWQRKLVVRYRKFEEFLSDYCVLTRRYTDEKDLKLDIPEANCYISGSDQLWNVRAQDFSDAYYLNFTETGKKISYAASFGPKEIDWDLFDKEEYSNYLKKYSYISVREEGSASNVHELTGMQCEVHVDPTLLLDVEQWRKIQSDANYNSGRYILLYCLEPSKEQLQMADMISKKLKLPILVLRYNNKNDMFNSFVKQYDAGPRDFLSYIDHATLVLTSSFHGTAFSLIYNKPFYVFQGMKDHRISSILKKTSLSERSIEEINEIEKVNLNAWENQDVKEFLENERSRSEQYLLKALEL